VATISSSHLGLTFRVCCSVFGVVTTLAILAIYLPIDYLKSGRLMVFINKNSMLCLTSYCISDRRSGHSGRFQPGTSEPSLATIFCRVGGGSAV
jgi:hypothetical protein